MNLLLNTRLVLWTAFWPSKIPRLAAQAIKRVGSVYISSVSVFEIELKASIGKLNIPFCEFEVLSHAFEPIFRVAVCTMRRLFAYLTNG